MLYSAENVKANLRNRDGKRVFYLGKGDNLTSEARDFLTRERIEILPADQAKPESYRLLGGGTVQEKPEHFTHLHGDVLVPKTHPRIRFRGAMDTLEAELLLCDLDGELGEELRQVLETARKLIRWEVLEQPVQEERICGLTPQELRRRSHFPQEYYGVPHFMPDFSDDPRLRRVNRARCAARNAELAAVEAFTDRDGNLTRSDIVTVLNRLSSMLYLIMIRIKGDSNGSGKTGK